MAQTTMLSDTQLARQLNRQAHRGGMLTDYGVWYALDARPGCPTYVLGDRGWTARRVCAARARQAELIVEGHAHVSVVCADGHGAYCAVCGETQG